MKSKRSKACEIPQSVREKVYQRDDGKCIICHFAGVPNAHFIPRSCGGLGIEQNIVTLCPACHYDYDNGFKRKTYGEKIEEYLKTYYGDTWNKKDLIYKKH